MSSGHHRVSLAVAIGGVLVMLSGTGAAALNEYAVPIVDVAVRMPPISRSATSRHVRRLAMPRNPDCPATWCGRPLILILGIGF
jgi:hypothetical protein